MPIKVNKDELLKTALEYYKKAASVSRKQKMTGKKAVKVGGAVLEKSIDVNKQKKTRLKRTASRLERMAKNDGTSGLNKEDIEKLAKKMVFGKKVQYQVKDPHDSNKKITRTKIVMPTFANGFPEIKY